MEVLSTKSAKCKETVTFHGQTAQKSRSFFVRAKILCRFYKKAALALQRAPLLALFRHRRGIIVVWGIFNRDTQGL